MRELIGQHVVVKFEGGGKIEGQLNGVQPERLILFADDEGSLRVLRKRIVSVEKTVYTCQDCAREVNVIHDGRCTNCARDWMHAHPPKQACDDCGRDDVNVWRDPLTRRNEYFCGTCHGKRGRVFQNRWAPWQSEPLGVKGRPECDARNVPGTKDCRGQVKPRAGGALLCNAHAGKEEIKGG